MTSVSDVLDYTLTKDAANLKPAIDDIMTDKLADYIDMRKAQVAADMFGQHEHNDEDVSSEQQELDTELDTEGTSDEIV